VIDDAFGFGNLPQGLAFVAFLAPDRLPDGSRELRVRFFSPSVDGGLPLLLSRPSRRSNSAIRAFKAAISAACADGMGGLIAGLLQGEFQLPLSHHGLARLGFNRLLRERAGGLMVAEEGYRLSPHLPNIRYCLRSCA
jgi:hypothetical protein